MSETERFKFAWIRNMQTVHKAGVAFVSYRVARKSVDRFEVLAICSINS